MTTPKASTRMVTPTVVQTPGNHVDDLLSGYYIHSKKLGEGGFGKVYLATHLKTNQKVAVKVMIKEKLAHDLPRVRTEISVLKTLQHENIAKLLQVVENEKQITLVLEYCAGGELFDYLVAKKRLNENEVRVIMWDLFNVLRYIHSHGFAHRDLKPENILFDENKKIKLIDFGLAANGQANKNNLMFLQTCCGSPAYAAPELLRGETYSGPAVDVWSSGVLLYSLLVGSLPFDDDDVPVMYRKIQSGKYTIPPYVSLDARDLITEMLKIRPFQRISVSGVINHRWFKRFHNSSDNDVDPSEVDSEAMELANRFFPEMSKDDFENAVTEYGYHTATYLLLKNNAPVKKVVSERFERSNGLFSKNNVRPTPSPNPLIAQSSERSNMKITAIKRKLAFDEDQGAPSNINSPKRHRDDDAKRFGVTMPYSNAAPARRPPMPLTGTPRLTRVLPAPAPKHITLPNRPSPANKTATRFSKPENGSSAKKVVSMNSRLHEKHYQTPTLSRTLKNVTTIKSPLRELKNEVNSPRSPGQAQQQEKFQTPAKKPIMKTFSASKRSIFKRIIDSARKRKQ